MGAAHCHPDADVACSLPLATGAAILGLGPPVLLLAGVAGVATPWLLHRFCRVSGHGRVGSALRAAGAGVVLGIALLHCLPEGADALACVGWADYPWGFLIAAAAAGAAALLENVLIDCQRGASRCAATSPADTVTAGATTTEKEGGGACVGPARPDGAHAPDDAEAGVAAAPPLQLTSASMRAHAHGPGIERPPPAFHTNAIAVLEVGISLHSLVVGFALGTARTGCAALPLLIAFAVHQLLEGAAVGVCLADSSLTRAGVLASAAAIALSAPAGAVVGLATRRVATGPAGLVVVGVADAVAAGLLLHTGLADLLASSAGVGLRWESPSKGRRLGAHALFGASLTVGLALAAVLAVWG